MRKKANHCPACKSQIEPGWKFCLACGEILHEEAIEQPADPLALTPRQEKAYRKGKIRCWQCNEKLNHPSPACPKCGADLLNPRRAGATSDIKDPGGSLSNLPLPVLVLFILMGVAVIGGVGFLMSASNQSGASENAEGFQMPSLPDISLDSIFGDDHAAAVEVPAGIDVKATEGRAITVDDSGAITVRIDGKDVNVRLAGVSDKFVDDCRGGKALARIRRILTEGAVVWVYLDGNGPIEVKSGLAEQSVYIWQVDPATDKIRFVNQEVIASGDAELQATVLTDQAPAPELVSAAERAKEKERGRFAEGACN